MTKELKFANYHAKQLYNIHKILNNISHNINKKNKSHINILQINRDTVLESLKEQLRNIFSSKKDGVSIYFYMPSNSIALQQNNQAQQEALCISDIIAYLNKNIKKYTEKLQQLDQTKNKKKSIKSIELKIKETIALKKIMNLANSGLISDLTNENTIIQKLQTTKEVIIIATPQDTISLQETLEFHDIDYNLITTKDLVQIQSKPRFELDNTSQKSLSENENISMYSY